MPHVIVTGEAAMGMARCRRFLYDRDSRASDRADQVIETKLALLERHPELGRPAAGQPGVRELVIGFGRSGYLALYRHVADQDTVYILAFRHQRESQY